MGITGKLVRSVFSRNRSFDTQESNVRSIHGEKKKWEVVKSYICGDEFNSVLAEEDSSSVKSSEATVTQPVFEDSFNNGVVQSDEAKEDVTTKEKYNSTSHLFRQDDAAITIQSAFRSFLARRHQARELEFKDDKQEGTETPSRASVGTSVDVQTGNSIEVLSVMEENAGVQHRVQRKARSQVLKLKEEWDDSTVSSNVTKMRIQNRLEASNRRQRALAYAFSQQLRVCSKKKHARINGSQTNLSWSWLERWMASRPESSVESHTGKQLENSPIALPFRKRFSDVAVEEKESCGSNEVSLQFDCLSISAESVKDGFKPSRSRLKPTRTISRRKTAPSSHCPKEQAKVTRKEHSKETEQDADHKPKQLGSRKETK